MSITGIVLVKNEETLIQKCLDNLLFCDQLIIIDDNSTDKSREILETWAKKENVQIFKRKLNDDFSAQRNFGLEKVKGEWVLFVDADEIVSAKLADEIKTKVQYVSEQITGFYIKRRDFLWGKELKYGETGNMQLLRLARKGSGEWKGKVHERWEIKGKTNMLENALYHYPHQTITQFLHEINYYTTLRSRELYEKKVKAYWFNVIIYPKAKFALNYFIKRGFLDGLEGLVLAMLMSFHSFLVRAKLWLLWQKE
ncbi:MAG TPA: glycosyltransferase family 2 protein [Candidatus Saccharimonadales bacterium]|nr:glycosyltransferase family 2 protein [Candidatus Saccharimonadales bacterium]